MTPGAVSNPLLEAARGYARRDWPVFPVKPGGKVPLTQHGLKDASLDPAELAGWWRRWPNANVAVRTGADARLVVLDVDGSGGLDTLHELETGHEPLPATASVVTPGGGQHFYFAHPGGEVRNSAGQLGPGLDIRGDGGYVLAPPSVGANGRRYEPDARIPLAPIPAWLLGLLRSAHGRKREPVDTWVQMVRTGLPQGERNAGMARLTGHLLHRDVDVRLVAEIAHLVNTRNRPPLHDDEIDRIVESIAGRELRRRNGR
jgi:hypothetical protein